MCGALGGERGRARASRAAHVRGADRLDAHGLDRDLAAGHPQAGRVRRQRLAVKQPVRGVGLRTYLVGDEPKTIHDIESLTFDNPVGSPDADEAEAEAEAD